MGVARNRRRHPSNENCAYPGANDRPAMIRGVAHARRWWHRIVILHTFLFIIPACEDQDESQSC